MKTYSKRILAIIFSLIALISIQSVFAKDKSLTVKGLWLSNSIERMQANITKNFFWGHNLSYLVEDASSAFNEKAPSIDVGVNNSGEEGIAKIWITNSSEFPIRIKKVVNVSQKKKDIKILGSRSDGYLDVGNTYEFEVKFNGSAKKDLALDVVYGIVNSPMVAARIILTPENDTRIYDYGTTIIAAGIAIYALHDWYSSEQLLNTNQSDIDGSSCVTSGGGSCSGEPAPAPATATDSVLSNEAPDENRPSSPTAELSASRRSFLGIDGMGNSIFELSDGTVVSEQMSPTKKK